MGIAEKLERLVRIIPGIAGYQDRATAGDTDKAVRLRLAAGLNEVKRDVEAAKKALADRKDLTLLPALNRVVSKLDKTANLLTYASRGYTGIFDTFRFDAEGLDRLYAFNISLLERVGSVQEAGKNLRAAPDLTESTAGLESEIDTLEREFMKRQEILTAG